MAITRTMDAPDLSALFEHQIRWGENNRFESHPDAAFHWQSQTAMPLADAMQVLGAGLPADTKIEFLWNEKNNQIEIAMEAKDRFVHTVNMSFGDRAFSGGDTTVELAARGNGIGPRILGNTAKLGLTLGFTKIEFQAGHLMGAHKWAPLRPAIRNDAFLGLKFEMLERLAPLRSILPKARMDRLEDCVMELDGKKLATIADMKDNLTESVDTLMREEFYYLTSERRKQATTPHLTVGRYMLLGLYYKAEIPLHDKAMLQRLEKFTGVKLTQSVSKSKLILAK